MWPRSFGRLSFFGRKETLAIETMLKEAKMVEETIGLTEGVIKAAGKGDWTLVEAESERVSSSEEKVDLIHREGMVMISEGAFFAGIREDILNLMETINNIADYSKDACRIVAQYPIKLEDYQAVFSADNPMSLIKKAEDAMLTLELCISQLFSNPRESVKLAMDVERKEEEGDEIKARLIKKIFQRRNSMDVLTLLELKDFVLWLDNVLDAIEEASDIAIIIAAKSGV
ncbi:DUF47 domain-containing protein [Tardisphaera saccharovorans]|mgnify:FL=1|nr:DUF47 family protein [TACK group archaeon]